MLHMKYSKNIAVTHLTQKGHQILKIFNLTVVCKAYYKSSIAVPDDFTREQALEYAKAHLNRVPIVDGLEYISESDELDEDNCDFA